MVARGPKIPDRELDVMAMKKFRSVDDYFDQLELWKPELTRLRELVLATGMDECLKWSSPCYTFEGKNVVGLSSFQSYFGLWFFQGALLEDPDQVLHNAQQGKTRGMRQWRMSGMRDIKVARIRDYLKRAIDVAASGAAVKPRRGRPVQVDPRLKSALAMHPEAATQFRQMTVGKRREYADYISEAKRDETKIRRIEKVLPMIAAGIGLHDRYRR